MQNAIEYNDATIVILNIVYLQKFDFNLLDYKIIAFGAALAVAQFYPEISNARIRLYLHLPLNHLKLIWILLLSGIGTLTVIFSFIYIVFWLISDIFYPKEVFTLLSSRLIPYFICSILGYLGVVLAFVEPRIFKKIVYIVLTLVIGVNYLMFNASGYFVNEYLNYILGIVVLVYTVTLFETFSSYTKGYIK